MTIENPAFLFLLLLLLPVSFIVIRQKRPSLLLSNVPDKLINKRQSPKLLIFAACELFVLAIFIIALANPKSVSHFKKRPPPGLDIMIAIDISLSMDLIDPEDKTTKNAVRKVYAEKNQNAKSERFIIYRNNKLFDRYKAGQLKSRIELVKQEVSHFIKSRPNDRIGIILFARQSYSLSPPTHDHQFLQERLNNLDPKQLQKDLGDDGDNFNTSLSAPLITAVQRLKDAQGARRILLMFSDGDHQKISGISPIEAATQAALFKIHVYTVGIGNKYALYPLNEEKAFFIKEEGVNNQLLNTIAEKTTALHYQVNDKAGLNMAMNEINLIETIDFAVHENVIYKDWRNSLLILGLILLAMTIIVESIIFVKLP